MPETHNPISGEELGIHEKSREEKAKDLGRTVEEYEKTVLTLGPKDQAARQRLTRYLEQGRYYDMASDDAAKMMAAELLGNGSFDWKSYVERLQRTDYYPNYTVQTASHAISVISQLLEGEEIKDITYNDEKKDTAA